jgi:hypothetical protein
MVRAVEAILPLPGVLVSFALRSIVLVSSLLLCACPNPVKESCASQADCASGLVCVSQDCVVPTATDAGVDAGTPSVTGAWNLVVKANYNGNAALRSYHPVVASEEDGGVIVFATPFCRLYATRTADSVALRANQSCTVPTGTALSIDQETTIGSGTFGARVEVTAPYCYTIWLSSSTSVPFSGTTYRFVGDGGVSENGDPVAACNQPGAQNNAGLQFDLSR